MRTATIIVGAIAVASCLVAAALVISSSDSGSTAKKVIHRQRRPPARPTSVTPTPTTAEASPETSLTSCSTSVSVGPDTSCPFGLNVARAYRGSNGAGKMFAYSPVTGKDYAMTCTGTAPVICTGGNGAMVYLGP